MEGQTVMQCDGISRPYSYREVTKISSTELVLLLVIQLLYQHSSEKGNTRFSFTNMDNDDISPESTLDRNSFSD